MFQSPIQPDMLVTEAPVKKTYISALGLSLVDAKPAAAIDALLAPGRRKAYFINAHCVNVMNRDRRYAAAVRSANMLLPDGFGIELAAKMSCKVLAANLNGTDLLPQLLAEAAKRGKSVYFFGGKPGTAQAAARTLITKIPHLQVVGLRDGYEGARDEDAVIADINASGADIVIVALGVPMQELWLNRNHNRLAAGLKMGVGAALDFYAGNVSRAPLWVRKTKSEWMWRLAMEPRRMASRYLIGNATFMVRASAKAAKQITLSGVASRALDITVSAAALAALAPVFALTAIAIKAESRGPVFFKQTRVGRDGVPFTMYKFRSMVANAEDLRASVLASSDREGVCFKSRNDPRITRVGKFIRRFSIDELPQIFNVLSGKMAIVGPRPALPCEVAAYPKHALGRLAVKPGITGVWQVSGRANIGFSQMIEMDLAYASSRSVLLDITLIAMTFRAVISGRGAH